MDGPPFDRDRVADPTVAQPPSAAARPPSTARRPLRSFGHWLAHELRAAAPVFVFFLIGFLLVLLIVKLALADYSIAVSTLSRAVIGALFAAKVTLVFDERPLAHPFTHAPRIVGLTVRTIVYVGGVLLVGLAERLLDAFRDTHSLSLALTILDATSKHRLLAIALGTGLIFAAYFAIDEINQRLGQGQLRAMFLTPPSPAEQR